VFDCSARQPPFLRTSHETSFKRAAKLLISGLVRSSATWRVSLARQNAEAIAIRFVILSFPRLSTRDSGKIDR
jgi:hypothetical protein